MHTPVFLEQVLEALNVKKAGKYIDATYGEGGHAVEIVKAGGKVLAIEWDETQIQNSEFRIQNLKIVPGNFKDVEKIAKKNNFYPVDGIFFDLGLSMRQIAEAGRGFSFMKKEEPLDMRISKNIEFTASDIINSLDGERLYEIFARNSEDVDSRAVGQAIVRARRLRKIRTVGDLVDIIDLIKPKSVSRLRRIFQALRIEVNQEFANLRRGLRGALKLLKKDGRIVVITFHSLEDRIVKNFAREHNLKFVKASPWPKMRKRFERSAVIRILTCL